MVALKVNIETYLTWLFRIWLHEVEAVNNATYLTWLRRICSHEEHVLQIVGSIVAVTLNRNAPLIPRWQLSAFILARPRIAQVPERLGHQASRAE